MSKPIVGITTGRYNRRPLPDELQTSLVACSAAYPQAVERSGGAPLLLPWTGEGEVLASVMPAVDALLLSGGGDIVSLRYGEEPHPRTRYQDPVRDAAELALIGIALDRGLPILGICRGIQALNVALGGTLVQDVASEVSGAVQHDTHERHPVLSHTVDIEPGSLLARILGATRTAVNSWHHQAVKALGKGLRVNARARDGVIEGVEADDGRPVLAVQCHPEASSREYPLFQKLFDWLVAEAGRAMRRK
ncbi:MAG: gamma-glutamyl-gamma-aminobutyrate hydrolase family protein [Kiritimatiellae bacterium]|nr:gamma-glutamyl-gamma-aminobutyrate hydrolase family protein [Kiritimatiellia bacterium]